jgi:hypothetical protein
MPTMRIRPAVVLAGTVCVIAASTFAFPKLNNNVTTLCLLIILGAWSILARLTSENFVHSHQLIMWIMAAVINLLYFLAPVAVIWLLARKRWPVFVSVAICVWCGFYLLCLFRLFPANFAP